MKRPVHRLCDTLWFSLSTTCAGLSSPTLQVSLLELSDGKHHGIGQLGGQDSVAGAQLEVVRGGVRRWRVMRDFEEEKKTSRTSAEGVQRDRSRCFHRSRRVLSLLSHLIDDFCKLLQGGAHHLIVAPKRKTLQWQFKGQKLLKYAQCDIQNVLLNSK